MASGPVLGLIMLLFFFFQAEDGIRDYKVTGVQTCALPISVATALGTDFIHLVAKLRTLTQPLPEGEEKIALGTAFINQLKTPPHKFTYEEIGRASCRERV